MGQICPAVVLPIRSEGSHTWILYKKAVKTARGYPRLVAQPGIQMGVYSGLKQSHVDCRQQSSDRSHCIQGYGLRIFPLNDRYWIWRTLSRSGADLYLNIGAIQRMNMSNQLGPTVITRYFCNSPFLFFSFLPSQVRTKQLNTMNPRVGVGVFVFNSQGQFIIGERKGSHGAGNFAHPTIPE